MKGQRFLNNNINNNKYFKGKENKITNKEHRTAKII